MPPSIARRRHKHQFHSAKGPYLAACASTSTTVEHAPARPVVSSTPALRAARATQAARAMLRVPIIPSPVRAHRLNHYLTMMMRCRIRLWGASLMASAFHPLFNILLHTPMTTMHLPLITQHVLGDGVSACFSAFRQVTGTGTKR